MFEKIKKTIKFYYIYSATDVYRQPSYLLGERSSFSTGHELWVCVCVSDQQTWDA
jgi:hypothetical protein